METFLRRSQLLCATATLLLTSATAQAQVPRRYPAATATSTAGSTLSSSQPHDYPLTPAPRYATGGHPGTYRLPDGSCLPAEIFGPNMPDRVRLRPENLSDYALFLPSEVPAYVVRGDTFVTVPAFVRRKGHHLMPAGYAQRLYNDAGYEVLLFQAPTPEILRTFNAPVVPNGPAVSAVGALPATPISPADAYTNSFFGAMLDLFVFPKANQTVLLRHAGQVQELPAKTRRYRQLMLTLLADDPAVCAQLRAGQLATRYEAPRLLAAYAAHRREALLQARK
jgi:hypothetical protein